MDANHLKENITHGTVMFPFAFYEWFGDFNYSVKLHWHEETEILYLEEGTFHFTNNMKKHVIQAPAIAFIGAGEIHSIDLLEKQRESALLFHMEMLYFEHFDIIKAHILKPLVEKKLVFPQFIFPQDRNWKEILSLYQKTITEARNSCISSQIKVKAYLLELIAVLYENNYIVSLEKIEEPITYQVEKVKKVITYIHENYNNTISTCKLACLIGMNEQYFCRYFKKITGKTLTEYINLIRIEKAAELLLKTQNKVIDIAIECGYSSIGYFNKKFKSIKSMTPQEFRKSMN